MTDRPTKSHEQIFLLSKGPRYFFDQEAVREPTKPTSGLRQAPSKHESNRNGDGYVQRDVAAFAEAKGANIRSVWEIATRPFPEAHFATYPEELVRRCLLAGCPERVCRVCGKPSERIVERETMIVRPAPKRAAWQESGDDHARTAIGGTVERPASSQTIGWSDCGHNAYRPGVVLDPFLGSGTTAHVARKHGRRTVGIELSEEYARIAARRLQQLSLLAEVAT